MTPGTLFLVGGKDGRDKDRVLIEHFARICGGKSARVLVITSATDTPEVHRREYTAAFRKVGVRDVSIYHAEEPAASESSKLLSMLDRVDGVYFSGGSQRKLMTVMGGGRFEKRLRERHRKGLHVGGTSAGASAMSQVMIAQGEGRKPIQPSSVELATGFGLLPRIIVDQHFQRRERLSRLIAAVSLNPAMLGFGLDEGTAVDIDSTGRARVFGKGALTIVDGSRLMGAKRNGSSANDRPLAFAGMGLHVLTEGWSYDLAARKVKAPRRSSAAH
ncbi:MAG TPA: cyanophycinase [Candidatus Eisenbacteria bacterium]|nr:cyanophycinase [Candidatus Eisenbacteria bacterium]